jgi:hypothetical protein
MFRLIAINFSQKSHNFSLLSPTSPCEVSEREVTSPSKFESSESPELEKKLKTLCFNHILKEEIKLLEE